MSQEEWDRIAELRRTWAPMVPREEEQLCVVDCETVGVRRVPPPSTESENGITYYRCGGGRRVVRKKIGN